VEEGQNGVALHGTDVCMYVCMYVCMKSDKDFKIQEKFYETNPMIMHVTP
jgi:hypothetical protein